MVNGMKGKAIPIFYDSVVKTKSSIYKKKM